jgi:hypothetical protein
VRTSLYRLHHDRQFAIYPASYDDHDESVTPPASRGHVHDTLDTACGPYLNDPHRLDPTPDELTETTSRRVSPGQRPRL